MKHVWPVIPVVSTPVCLCSDHGTYMGCVVWAACLGDLDLAGMCVGRLLEADSDSGVVREFLRMFASEAKQRRNTNRDSSRTVLAMNLGTGHTTYKRAGARRALQCVERDVQVVRRNVAKERT